MEHDAQEEGRGYPRRLEKPAGSGVRDGGRLRPGGLRGREPDLIAEMECAKLLVCDDHPPIRAAVPYMARELFADIDIVEAGNGAEALTQLERHPDIELVLLDLHMPG